MSLSQMTTSPLGHRARAHRAERASEASGSAHNFTVTRIDGTKESLSAYRGAPILIVNTATQCLFASQFEALQSLHERYSPHGFSVLAFPSDQFLQDPGSSQDTENFCRGTYKVTFPIYDKIPVNGPEAPPLWRWLAAQGTSLLSRRVSWNFTKFLIDADGQLVRRYSPLMSPHRIERDIQRELHRAGRTRAS